MSWEQMELFSDRDLGITPKIIGLTGYARSGKDTIANILVEEHGYIRIGFADAIRDFLLKLNPILMDGHRLGEYVGLYGWEVAKAQDEVRRLLQETGMAARQIFGEDFWVEQVLQKIGPTDNVVIPDVRFKNEAHIITLLSGQLWRVNRPGVKPVNSHISESDLDDYAVAHVIDNSKSVLDLKSVVDGILSAHV